MPPKYISYTPFFHSNTFPKKLPIGLFISFLYLKVISNIVSISISLEKINVNFLFLLFAANFSTKVIFIKFSFISMLAFFNIKYSKYKTSIELSVYISASFSTSFT